MSSSRAVVALVAGLALLAYRRALLWDPGAPGLPSLEWFFFVTTSETSPPVVFAIAAGLVYGRRGRLREVLRDGTAPLAAVPFLLIGSALFVWGHYVGAPDLLIASFVPACLGAALLVSGRRLAGSLALPLLVLLFAIPFPAVLTNHVVFPLQLLTAKHTAWLLGVTGIPAVQEGDVLYLPDRTFEVIESCSGLRSIGVLVLLGVAWLSFFPAPLLHAALVLACAPVIAYFVNVLRVLSLVLNPESDLSAMHAFQGIALFLAGFIALYAIDGVLRRLSSGRRRVPEPAPGPARAGAAGGPRRGVLILVAWLGAMLAASSWGPRWEPSEPAGGTLVALPDQLDGWTATETLAPDRMFLGTVVVRDYAYRRYERDGQVVSVFLARDDRLQRHESLVSPKHALPGRGWVVERLSVERIGPDGPGLNRVLARSGGTRTLSHSWAEHTAGPLEEVLRALLATDRSPWRREAALVVRLTTEIEPTSDGRERAEARLRQVGQLARGLIPVRSAAPDESNPP